MERRGVLPHARRAGQGEASPGKASPSPVRTERQPEVGARRAEDKVTNTRISYASRPDEAKEADMTHSSAKSVRVSPIARRCSDCSTATLSAVTMSR